MQTTAIGTVANSLPENEVILLTLLISKGYILFAELVNNGRFLKFPDGRDDYCAVVFTFVERLRFSGI